MKERIRKFETECTKAAESLTSAWGHVDCHYLGAKREYVLTCEHSWGTAYCNWTESDRNRLIDKLKKIGAVNITTWGKMDFNYIGLRFDLSVKKFKEYQSDPCTI